MGCGLGPNAIFLGSRGVEVTGIDLSPEAIAEAEKRLSAAGMLHAADSTEQAKLLTHGFACYARQYVCAAVSDWPECTAARMELNKFTGLMRYVQALQPRKR